MNKKRISVILSVACIAFGVIVGAIFGRKSINNLDDERIYSSAVVSYYEFDEILDMADNVIAGVVTEITSHDQYDSYTVTVISSSKGNLEGTVEVKNYLYEYMYEYQNSAYSGITCTDYEVGGEYLFILEHIDSVYGEEFAIISDAYIPLEGDEECYLLSKSIDIDDVSGYVDSYEYKENSASSGLANEYVDSTDLQEIISESQYILKVEIGDFLRETENCDIYYCSVLENLQGNPCTTENNQIIVPFFKDTVVQGESYIILLNADTEDAIIYTLSSKSSVRELSETENIEGIVGGDLHEN